MKAILATLLIFLPLGGMAEANYCGRMTALMYLKGDYSRVLVILRNHSALPRAIYIYNADVVEELIGVVSNRPNYRHQSVADNYYWEPKDDVYPQICVTGTDLVEAGNRMAMPEVTEFEIVTDGEVISKSVTPSKKTQGKK